MDVIPIGIFTDCNDLQFLKAQFPMYVSTPPPPAPIEMIFTDRNDEHGASKA